MRYLFPFGCLGRLGKLAINNLTHTVAICALILATGFARTQTLDQDHRFVLDIARTGQLCWKHTVPKSSESP